MILKREEEDHVCIGGKKRVVIIDGDVTFDIFESQIKYISGSGSSHVKIIYSLKCKAMTIRAYVPVGWI